MTIPRIYRALVFVLALCGLCSAAVTVDEIVIQSATEDVLPESMIRANMTLQPGSEFTPELLSQDIKKLYLTKQFDDVEASVDSSGADAVRIIVKVKLKARVSEIVFHGNSKIKASRLKKELTQKTTSTLDEKLLSADLAALYELYRDKGYHDVAIRQQVVPADESSQVKIVYEVDEKGRYKTREVHVIGNIRFTDRELKRIIKTKVSKWGYIFPLGFFDEQQLKSDLDAIQKAYWDEGFLDYKLENVDRVVSSDNEKIYVTIYVAEGQQYRVPAVTVSGNTAFATTELTAVLALVAGSPYNRETERSDIDRITEKYNRIGYLDCYVYADRATNAESHEVSVDYVVSEGQPSHIRDINIVGNAVTKDEVIRRELQIQPGDLSDSSKIEASKASLYNLGYFDSVDIIPTSTDETDKKDLTIKIKEKLTGQLLFGAGFSSTDNVLGTVEVSQSNFDLFNYPTFRGGGQRFRLRAQAGSSRKDFVLAFTEPWLWKRPLRLDYELWERETTSNRDFDENSIGTSFTLTRKMSHRFWRQSVGYRLEQVDIANIDADFSRKFFREEEGDDTVSAVSLGFVRDHRDRLLLTSSGSRLSLRMELHGQLLGSYTDLCTINISGDKYYPIFETTVLKLSAEIAQAARISGDEPRIFDRFFTGGANSIRGFRERDVGPIDVGAEPNGIDNNPIDGVVDRGSGEPIGGKSLLLLSSELTGPIYEKTIFWSLFADSGNVWDDAWDINLGELNVGVGTGLRLFLPIGAIRLDYGWPIVREQEHLGSGGRFHFNLGYNF